MPDALDLPQLVTEVIAEVQATAEARGVHVAARDLASMPHWVDADDQTLRRLLLNMLDLAVQTATHGVIVLRLDALDPNQDRWTFVVEWRDDGEGAIEEVRCAFVARLPAGQGNELTRALRVLVVDDSAQHRSIVAAYLAGTPHEAVEAIGGADAVARLRAESFDVVLMDLQMPDMDGLSATRAIRAHERDTGAGRVPIVALTARGPAVDAAEATAAGADACLAKPVGRTALFRTLATLPMPTPIPEPAPAPSPVLSPSPLDSDQLLASTRREIANILSSAPEAQAEQLCELGRALTTTAAEAGLSDVSHLAAALDRAAEAGSLNDARTAARTLLAWVNKMCP
jgi:CheY-like chemotaxis protein